MTCKCFQIKYINNHNISISIDKNNFNKIISEENINKKEKLTLLLTRLFYYH